MARRASIAGHPIHPMLVTIPIGLFLFSFVADLAVYLGGAESWATVAFYCIGGGIAGALLAAVFGLVDLLSMTDEKVKKIGFAHMALNLGVVALFAINFILRWNGHEPQGTPFALTVLAMLMLLVAGWLGGEMVFVHGAAVSNARNQPAVERRKMQTPVRHERRTMRSGPIGQH